MSVMGLCVPGCCPFSSLNLYNSSGFSKLLSEAQRNMGKRTPLHQGPIIKLPLASQVPISLLATQFLHPGLPNLPNGL